MKVLITLQLILIISIPSFSQTYIGLGLLNKGVDFSLGTLVDGIDLQFNYKVPLTSAEEPNIMSITLGKMILLSDKDEDNYSITPILGGAWLKGKDFSKYDADPLGAILETNKFNGVYGLELSKDAYMGRLSLVAKHIGGMYYGVSVRVFFSR